eukprot:1142131-Pelagomonas_calceolata.AAC.2
MLVSTWNEGRAVEQQTGACTSTRLFDYGSSQGLLSGGGCRWNFAKFRVCSWSMCAFDARVMMLIHAGTGTT